MKAPAPPKPSIDSKFFPSLKKTESREMDVGARKGVLAALPGTWHSAFGERAQPICPFLTRRKGTQRYGCGTARRHCVASDSEAPGRFAFGERAQPICYSRIPRNEERRNGCGNAKRRCVASGSEAPGPSPPLGASRSESGRNRCVTRVSPEMKSDGVDVGMRKGVA